MQVARGKSKKELLNNDTTLKINGKSKKSKLKKELPYYIMLIPSILLISIFAYVPMGGLVMAFQRYNPGRGFIKSKFVGLENFRYVFNQPNMDRIIYNTVFIATSKVVLGILVPLALALLINELVGTKFKRVVQTSFFLPYFLSWAILAAVMFEIFSLNGPINAIIEGLGGNPISFFTNNSWFPKILIGTDVWKCMGYNLVIYLAAITNTDQTQYEAAVVDGANRLQQLWYVTIPAILPIIILTSTLAIGGILNAGFDQIYLLYNPLVYESADVLDTFIFRLGINNQQYSPAAALGMVKSTITLGLTSLSYYLAYKFRGYRIF